MYDSIRDNDKNRQKAPASADTPPVKRGRIHAFICAHPLAITLFIGLYIVYMIVSSSLRQLMHRQEVDQQDASAKVGLSVRHYKEGDYDKTISINRQIEKEKGNHWYTEMTTGNAFFKKADFDQALIHFQTSTSLNSNMPLPYLNMALTLYRLGRIEDARNTYTYVIKHFGDEYPAMKKRAVDALYLLPQPSTTKHSTVF